MATAQNPAIELLLAQVNELEQKANAFRLAVNHLCEKDGVPPMFPNGGGNGNGAKAESDSSGQRQGDSANIPTAIKPDSFYGKKQQTAVREYLMIRKTNDGGPAKPGDILDGLRAGGYQVEAKTDEIALVGLRAMLRKASTVFHKLPNGTWGLKEWYPNAKSHKDSAAKPAQQNKDSAPPPSETEGSNNTHTKGQTENRDGDDALEASVA